ncbi:MAG TPA: ATP-binding cassette domain-containing protein [Aliiroseovarius sp.]|nr:ATP-binding cassette domain-containing protein [Aliiroseovarius sp.]
MLELDRIEAGPGPDFLLSANMKLPAHGIIAVLGPSGAGKSTLLDAIAGFLPLRRGRILWEGRDISSLTPARRPVSILFQDGNLFGHLTVAKNVALGLHPSLKLSASDRAKVAKALERVGLETLGDRRPAELSGGQAARVALARALIRARPIMLLDEPFGALGPGLKAEMLELVRDLARETGALVLMVSHDPNDARAIADQVVLVDAGVAHPPVETGALFAKPPPALAAYLGK